jgi:uncharacterized membrane protein YfcA
MSFDLSLFPLLWAAVIVASILRAFTGFGFALAAVPIFAHLVAPHTAVVLSASLVFVTSLLNFPTLRKSVSLDSAGIAIGVLLLVSIVSALATADMDAKKFQLYAGLALMLGCSLLVFRRFLAIKKTRVGDAIAGLLAGLMNGMFAMPGPPLVIYLLSTEPDPIKCRANIITFMLIAAAFALFSFAMAGYFSWANVWLFLGCFPVMVVGDRLGAALFGRYGQARYRQVAIMVLLVIACTTVASAFYAR